MNLCRADMCNLKKNSDDYTRNHFWQITATISRFSNIYQHSLRSKYICNAASNCLYCASMNAKACNLIQTWFSIWEEGEGSVENPLWRCVNNRYLRIAKIFVEWTEECRSNIFFRAQNEFLYFSETTPTPSPDKGESFWPRKRVIYSCVYESSTYKTFPKRHCVNIVSRHKCISQQWRQVSTIKKKSKKYWTIAAIVTQYVLI